MMRAYKLRSDQIIQCITCGMNYCPNLVEDQRQHERKCRTAQAARDAYNGLLPYQLPLSYSAREEMKDDRSGDSLEHAKRVMVSHS